MFTRYSDMPSNGHYPKGTQESIKISIHLFISNIFKSFISSHFTSYWLVNFFDASNWVWLEFRSLNLTGVLIKYP
jgi:hypothetical protein